MKAIPQLHDWNLPPEQAIELQRRLSEEVRACPFAGDVARVVGVDVSLRHGKATGAAIAVDFPALVVKEVQVASAEVDFPYVPGLLSFREIPVLLTALGRLSQTPDIIMVDGQGIAHPRRLGLAAHLGLLLELPTFGCAKSRLCGTYDEPGPDRGNRSELLDGQERIGTVLRTRDRVRPLYVSTGHLITLDQAVDYTLACSQRYRLPEPIRLAYQAAAGTLRLDK